MLKMGKLKLPSKNKATSLIAGGNKENPCTWLAPPCKRTSSSWDWIGQPALVFLAKVATHCRYYMTSDVQCWAFVTIVWQVMCNMSSNQGYGTTMALTSTYRQLAHHWELLVCLLSTHLASNGMVNEVEQEENTRAVVNKRVYRRPECQARRTRDCIVLDGAATILRRISRLLSTTASDSTR